MKLIKSFLIVIIVGALMTPSICVAQNQSNSNSFGIAVKGSTNGLGADFVFGFTTPITVRLGFETLSYKTNLDFTEQNISYNADLKFQTGSISLLGDFYFGNNFFLSAGLAKSLLKVDFDGAADEALPFGDIEIPADMIGNFNFQIAPKNGIMPYLGFGLGRTIGLNKSVGFAFEAGAFYQGQLGFDITSTGLLSPTSNPAHAHGERLEKQVSQYVWYPVAKLSLSYKISNF